MNTLDTPSTISDNNVDPILSVNSEEKDPNWQDDQSHGLSNYLRERHWIKQVGPTNRWKNRKLFNCSGSTELRLSDLGRELDDPGDAFYELFLSTHRYTIHLRTWFEVTEVFLPELLPELAKMVNRFIQYSNGLQGDEYFDAERFIKSINLLNPDACLQRKMVDKVITAIKKKVQKGLQGGSYKSLANDYGRGQLIVGLPLWYATLPADPMDPTSIYSNFYLRMNLALNDIKHNILLKNWCPFDSVVIVWHPTLQAIEEWLHNAKTEFYTDPANISLKRPFSIIDTHNFLKELNLTKTAKRRLYLRWDRYSSLNAMLKDQRRWFRFTNNPRPLGPKACLVIRKSKKVSNSLLLEFYIWLIQILIYVRVKGWRALQHRITAFFSLRRLYTFLRLIFKMKRLYRSETSNRSNDNDNDQAD